MGTGAAREAHVRPIEFAESVAVLIFPSGNGSNADRPRYPRDPPSRAGADRTRSCQPWRPAIAEAARQSHVAGAPGRTAAGAGAGRPGGGDQRAVQQVYRLGGQRCALPQPRWRALRGQLRQVLALRRCRPVQLKETFKDAYRHALCPVSIRLMAESVRAMARFDPLGGSITRGRCALRELAVFHPVGKPVPFETIEAQPGAVWVLRVAYEPMGAPRRYLDTVRALSGTGTLFPGCPRGINIHLVRFCPYQPFLASRLIMARESLTPSAPMASWLKAREYVCTSASSSTYNALVRPSR
jgi:hypothetical protein